MEAIIDKVIALSLAVVLGAAATGNLGRLQSLVWRHEAQLLYESRTSNWGSPRFFPAPKSVMRVHRTG